MYTLLYKKNAFYQTIFFSLTIWKRKRLLSIFLARNHEHLDNKAVDIILSKLVKNFFYVNLIAMVSYIYTKPTYLHFEYFVKSSGINK